MTKNVKFKLLYALLILILAGCTPIIHAAGPSTDMPASTVQEYEPKLSVHEAQVQSLEIQVVQSDPVQVYAIVRGALSESCEVFTEPQVRYADGIFYVTLMTSSPIDQGCTQLITPYKQTIPLETANLLPGTYTAIANGISTIFTLPANASQTGVPSPTVPLPTASPIKPAAECQDSAQYIGDDSMDGNTYPPNTAFTKTWSVKNNGTCTWDSHYLIFQMTGAYMTQQPGYWILKEGQTVQPGQTLDISIGMTSPIENGNYRSYWVLKNSAGLVMPIQDSTYENAVYVDINVAGADVKGEITNSSIDIVQEQGSGTACTPEATYFVQASISSDGRATASYEIESSAGQISAGFFEDNGEKSPTVSGTLVFSYADTKTINLRFVGPYPYPDDITIRLMVNGGEWLSAKLYCP